MFAAAYIKQQVRVVVASKELNSSAYSSTQQLVRAALAWLETCNELSSYSARCTGALYWRLRVSSSPPTGSLLPRDSRRPRSFNVEGQRLPDGNATAEETRIPCRRHSRSWAGCKIFALLSRRRRRRPWCAHSSLSAHHIPVDLML